VLSRNRRPGGSSISHPQFFSVRLHEVGHAVEAEIHRRYVAGVHRGAEPLIRMPAIDPARYDTEAVGGSVIVEHAFRGVQDLSLLASAVT